MDHPRVVSADALDEGVDPLCRTWHARATEVIARLNGVQPTPAQTCCHLLAVTHEDLKDEVVGAWSAPVLV